MFSKSKKKIQILQDELYVTKLENASLRSRLAKAQAASKQDLKKQEFQSNKKTTIKKAVK